MFFLIILGYLENDTDENRVTIIEPFNKIFEGKKIAVTSNNSNDAWKIIERDGKLLQVFEEGVDNKKDDNDGQNNIIKNDNQENNKKDNISNEDNNNNNNENEIIKKLEKVEKEFKESQKQYNVIFSHLKKIIIEKSVGWENKITGIFEKMKLED